MANFLILVCPLLSSTIFFNGFPQPAEKLLVDHTVIKGLSLQNRLSANPTSQVDGRLGAESYEFVVVDTPVPCNKNNLQCCIKTEVINSVYQMAVIYSVYQTVAI